MKGTRTGLGIVFGAALGLLFGQMLFENWWFGPMIGVAAGLIVGAVADLQQGRDESPGEGDDSGD